MIVRHFRDSDHSTWRVWAVRPATVLSERRRAPDRRTVPVDQASDPPLLERRRGEDRRRARANLRARGTHVLPQQWQDGWLVFEAEARVPGAAPSDVRRLAPIPEDWERCLDDRLGEYLARALVAERRTA